MRIDMANVQDVHPQAPMVGEAWPGSPARMDVDSLPKAKPTEAAAQALDPLSGAGVAHPQGLGNIGFSIINYFGKSGVRPRRFY